MPLFLSRSFYWNRQAPQYVPEYHFVANYIAFLAKAHFPFAPVTAMARAIIAEKMDIDRLWRKKNF